MRVQAYHAVRSTSARFKSTVKGEKLSIRQMQKLKENTEISPGDKTGMSSEKNERRRRSEKEDKTEERV